MKRKAEQSPTKNQLHLLQSTAGSKDQYPYDRNDSDLHPSRGKHLEPQAYPGAGAYGADYGRAAQAFHQQIESQSGATPTRNLDPQTLQSSTDSFNQMQGDIMRLQAKIRGLESRLHPDGPTSSVPLQPQARNANYTVSSHAQVSYAVQPYERGPLNAG